MIWHILNHFIRGHSQMTSPNYGGGRDVPKGDISPAYLVKWMTWGEGSKISKNGWRHLWMAPKVNFIKHYFLISGEWLTCTILWTLPFFLIITRQCLISGSSPTLLFFARSTPCWSQLVSKIWKSSWDTWRIGYWLRSEWKKKIIILQKIYILIY